MAGREKWQPRWSLELGGCVWRRRSDPGAGGLLGLGLGIRGWRWVGLGVGMGGFRDQGVETGRFRGGDGWV